jgi:hypothetical protein
MYILKISCLNIQFISQQFFFFALIFQMAGFILVKRDLKKDATAQQATFRFFM